jgi:hypothetical protein
MALQNVLNFPLVSRDIKTGTFTLDTAIYAANEVLCDLLSISVAPVAGTTVTLNSIALIDTDAKVVTNHAFTLFFFDRSVTMAAKNATWAVSDSDMATAFLGSWPVVAGDWTTAGALNRTAFFTGLEIFLKPNSGTSIFIGACTNAAVPAGTAGSLSIKLGIY